MRKWSIPLVGLLIICVVTGLWWAHGGQGWVAIKTGTRCGSTGEPYCYWSGFGSVMPWSLFVLAPLFSLVVLQWRRFNCEVHGCWRIGRHMTDAGHHVCRKHHPDEHLTAEAVTAAHTQARERLHLYLGGRPGRG